jgi:hypothetical protein
LVLELSYQLVTPELELHDLDRTGHLTLVRPFLHLCIRPDGMLKAAGAGTSIIVSLEYSRPAFLRKGLMDPVEGTLIQLPVHQLPGALQAELKKVFYHNSLTSSGCLQGYLRYGKKPAVEEHSRFRSARARDLSSVSLGTLCLPSSRLQGMLQGAQKQAEQLLRQLRQLCHLPEDAKCTVDLKHIKDDHDNTLLGFNLAWAAFS